MNGETRCMHLHVDATKFIYEKKYIQIVHKN